MALVQTMQALRYVPRALLAYGTGFVGPNFISGVEKPNPACGGLPKADPSGTIVRSDWASGISNPTPAANRIEHLSERKYHKPMTPNSASGFTATMTLAQAINDAGSTDHAKVQKAPRSLNDHADQTIMPWDGVEFDSNGQTSRLAPSCNRSSAGAATSRSTRTT